MGRDISIYERLSFGFPFFFLNVFSRTIHSKCVFLILHFSPLLLPCPHLFLLLLFREEQASPGYQPKWQNKLHKSKHKPSSQGWVMQPRRRKRVPRTGERVRGTVTTTVSSLGVLFVMVVRINPEPCKWSASILPPCYYAQDPFYYDSVAQKELNSTLHQTSSQTATFVFCCSRSRTSEVEELSAF